MSNGTPEIFEGGPDEPPGLLVVVSLLYAVLWVAVAAAALLFHWTALTSRTWLVAISVVLFAAAIAVLGREMGFFGARAKHK